jgi:hypothetical protein
MGLEDALGAFNPHPAQVPHRAFAGAEPELSGKMKPADPGLHG